MAKAAGRAHHPALPFLLPVLMAVLLTACGGLSGEPRIVATIPPPPTAAPVSLPATIQPNIAAGERIYVERCAGCHGLGGAGDGELVVSGQVGAPVSFVDAAVVRERTPLGWFEVITNGRLERLMPPWGDALSAQQRWDVTAYIYTLHYEASRESGIDGAAIWAQHCADCHTAPFSAETLFGRSEAQLFQRVASGAGDQSAGTDPMPAFSAAHGGVLNDDEIYAALAHLRLMAFTSDAAPDAGIRTGMLSGRVSNGTAGGEIPAGIPVALFVFDEQFAPQQYEATTDETGSFTFDGLSVRAGYTYAVGAVYQDRLFFSDFVRGDTADGGLELPVSVYDLTDDPAVLTIVDMLYQLTPVEEGLQVVQTITYHNSTDRAYSTDEAIAENLFASVTVPLPPDAQVIQVPGTRDRYRLLTQPRMLIDTVPALPDTAHAVQVAFLLPYRDDLHIAQRMPYAVDALVRVQIHPATLAVRSQQLSPMQTSADENPASAWYMGMIVLPAGEMLRFDLAMAGRGGSLAERLPLIALASSAGLAALVAGIYVVRRYLLRTPPIETTPESEELIRQIAALDEAHERGELASLAYQRTRGELKARLIRLWSRRQ
ncbi:cytochrome c [Geitlerinema splendidum]|nr:cytochrome c [Geitlerinema splendidum]